MEKIEENTPLTKELRKLRHEINPNFNKEVFKKKVRKHIECGYSKELAEWKVLGDFNRLFFKAFGIKPNKRQTDIDGYYM